MFRDIHEKYRRRTEEKYLDMAVSIMNKEYPPLEKSVEFAGDFTEMLDDFETAVSQRSAGEGMDYLRRSITTYLLWVKIFDEIRLQYPEDSGINVAWEKYLRTSQKIEIYIDLLNSEN